MAVGAGGWGRYVALPWWPALLWLPAPLRARRVPTARVSQPLAQVCLVARKGEDPPGMRSGVGSDIIYRCRGMERGWTFAT